MLTVEPLFLGCLWIRRVLVRAQEGQLEAEQALAACPASSFLLSSACVCAALTRVLPTRTSAVAIPAYFPCAELALMVRTSKSVRLWFTECSGENAT
jgi:hypothetical protein